MLSAFAIDINAGWFFGLTQPWNSYHVTYFKQLSGFPLFVCDQPRGEL